LKKGEKMKKYKIGYTQGVFDMFHVGHLNLINRAKEQCEFLIVGVNSDELVLSYKNKKTIVGENERVEIVANIKAVDKAVISDTLDKVVQHKKLQFDAIFIGDDWKGSERWKATEEELAKIGVDLVYLPYTQGVSSTKLRVVADNSVEEN